MLFLNKSALLLENVHQVLLGEAVHILQQQVAAIARVEEHQQVGEHVEDRVAEKEVPGEDEEKGPGQVAPTNVGAGFQRDERLHQQVAIICLQKAVHRLEGAAKAARGFARVVIHLVCWRSGRSWSC